MLTHVVKGLIDLVELLSGLEGELVVEGKGVLLLLETFGTSDCFRVSIAWFVFSFLRGFSGVTRGVIFGSLSEGFDWFTAVTGGVLLLDFKMVLVLDFFFFVVDAVMMCSYFGIVCMC